MLARIDEISGKSASIKYINPSYLTTTILDWCMELIPNVIGIKLSVL
jgi:hypothetical protein